MVKRFEGLIKAIVEHPQMDTQAKPGVPLGRALLCNATVDLLCNKTKEVVDLIKMGDFDRVRTTFAEFRDLVRIALAADCKVECPVPKEAFVRKSLVK